MHPSFFLVFSVKIQAMVQIPPECKKGRLSSPKIEGLKIGAECLKKDAMRV